MHPPSLEVIRACVTAYPASVKEEYHTGRLPLHKACYHIACPCEVIELLVEAFPEALQHADNKGLFPLHLFLMSAWMEQAETSRPTVDVERLVGGLVRRYPGVLDKGPSLPIQLALQAGLSCATIRCMIENHPTPFTGRSDPKEWFPLHRVFNTVRSGAVATIETVRYLYEKFPAAIVFKEKYGSLPIHIALRCKGLDVAIIDFLIERDPTCVHGKGPGGALPLSVACLGQPLEILLCLLRHYPGAVNERNSRDGSYPLHQLCANRQATRELIELRTSCSWRLWPGIDSHGVLVDQLCLGQGQRHSSGGISKSPRTALGKVGCRRPFKLWRSGGAYSS